MLTHRRVSLGNTSSHSSQHSCSRRTQPKGFTRVLVDLGRGKEEDSAFCGCFNPRLVMGSARAANAKVQFEAAVRKMQALESIYGVLHL